MGGVDLVDRYVSYYRIQIKTKKWTARLFTHFLDLAVCNAWIQYQRDTQAMGTPKKEVLSQLQFKQDIAETLIRGNPAPNNKQRHDTPAADNTRPVQLPNIDTRSDRFDHFPEFCSLKNAMRCRNDNCKGKTRVKCIRCNVFLCLHGKNCSVKFHNDGNLMSPYVDTLSPEVTSDVHKCGHYRTNWKNWIFFFIVSLFNKFF